MVKPIYIFWAIILVFSCKERTPSQEQYDQNNVYPSTLLNNLKDKGFSIINLDSMVENDLNIVFQVVNSGTFFTKDFKSELHLKVVGINDQIIQDTSISSGNIYSTIETKGDIIINEKGAYFFRYYVCPDGNDPCKKKRLLIQN
jgi:hypothetical protein